MLIPVRNMDKNSTLYFSAKTPYDAMKKLIYYLAIADKKAEKLTINKTESNRFLYTVYKGDTYCVRM